MPETSQKCCFCGDDIEPDECWCEDCTKLTHFERQLLRLLSTIATRLENFWK